MIQPAYAIDPKQYREHSVGSLRKNIGKIRSKLSEYKKCIKTRSCTKEQRNELITISVIIATLLVGTVAITTFALKSSRKKIEPTKDDVLPLAQAVFNDYPAKVKRIIADLKKKNINISAAVNITATTIEDDNIPLLVYAAKHGNEEIVKILLDNGADPNKGFPLHNAILYGNHDTAKLLLQKRAHVNAQEPVAGSTPLHIAARKSGPKTIQLLLEYNADPSIGERDNTKPIDIIKAPDREPTEKAEIISLLEEAAQKANP